MYMPSGEKQDLLLGKSGQSCHPPFVVDRHHNKNSGLVFVEPVKGQFYDLQVAHHIYTIGMRHLDSVVLNGSIACSIALHDLIKT
jgi:hypothetical protein